MNRTQALSLNCQLEDMLETYTYLYNKQKVPTAIEKKLKSLKDMLLPKKMSLKQFTAEFKRIAKKYKFQVLEDGEIRGKVPGDKNSCLCPVNALIYDYFGSAIDDQDAPLLIPSFDEILILSPVSN
jgi:hypothetical protein